MALIIDASVAVGWAHSVQSSPMKSAALDFVKKQDGWVPAHFAAEVLRSLRCLARRKLLSDTAITDALQDLRQLPLKQDDVAAVNLLPEVQALAKRTGLTSNDAAYLELALRTGLPLATRDAALAAAARAAGVTLFQP